MELRFRDTGTWTLSEDGQLQPESEWPQHEQAIRSIAILDGGKRLAALDADGLVVVWNLGGSVTSQELSIRVRGDVYELQALPDDRCLVTAGASGWQMWDASSRQPEVLVGHDRSISGLAFRGGPTPRLVTASEDETVRTWIFDQDSVSPQSTATVGHVQSFTVTDTGRAAWSVEGSLYFGDVDRLEPSINRQVFTDSLWYGALAFSPAGDELAAVGTNASATNAVLRLIRTDSTEERIAVESSASEALAVAYHPTLNRLAVGDSNGEVLIYDSATGELRDRWAAHDGAIYSLQFAPDGQTLATGSVDHTIVIWDWQNSSSHVVLRGNAARVFALDFSHDGRTLASGGDDGAIRLWDAKMGYERAAFRGHDSPVRKLSFSAADQLLASGDDTGRVLIWKGPTSSDATFQRRLTE